MLKKLICIIFVLLFCLMTAHAEETQNPMELTGYWLDSWSKRANMTIVYDGEKHKATIRWAGSAFEHIQWELTGLFEENQLTANDCRKTSHFFSEDGTEEIVVHYENEHSVLTITDNAIRWTDTEGAGADCVFERYDEIDLSDIYNPDHHAHLYIADLIAAADGSLYVQGTLGTIHENGTLSGFDLRESLMLPLSSDCQILLPDGSSDLFAWFDAQNENRSFYAIIRINAAGEVEKLLCSEDQPEAPAPEEAQPEQIMVVPAPPTGK